MENILFILLLLTLGYFLKFARFPENFSHSLNLFIIYVSLPATILLQIPKVSFDQSMLLPALTPWVVLVVSIIFVYFLTKSESKNTRASLMLLIPLGNTSFFGFPMLESLIGEESIKYGVIYDQLGSFLILAIYGSFIIAYYEGKELSLLNIFKKIFIFPPFLTMLFSFLLGDMPEGAISFVEILSNTLTPLAMISVGFSMRLSLGEDRAIFYKAMILKLLFIPILVFCVFKIFGFDGMVANVTFLESAMPPMITAGALAISSGFAPRLSSALVGYGIAVSLVTLSIFATFLHL